MSGTIPIGGPRSQGALQQQQKSSGVRFEEPSRQGHGGDQGPLSRSALIAEDSFEMKAAANRPPGITSISVSSHTQQSFQSMGQSPYSMSSIESPTQGFEGEASSPGQAAGDGAPPKDGPNAENAKRVLAMEDHLRAQMIAYGDGHPQAGAMAVSFANMCVDMARGCMGEGRKKLARLVLEKAIHFLKMDHSVSSFGNNQRALAACYCNLGALMQRRNMPDEALKYMLKAIKIEATMDYEPGHAATFINASSTYSLLGRHEEGLASAKRAVDMLCSKTGWHLEAPRPESDTGELLPVAFNNLGIEFEHKGDKEMALNSYHYALHLATARWGAKDRRTAEFRAAKEEFEGGKELVNYDIEMARQFYGTKPKVHKPTVRGRLKLLRPYVETTSPVERSQEKSPGWFSPRFWSSTDGMNPRRMSAYNKDVTQIGLEMAKTMGPALFPSVLSAETWGESRVKWRDMSDVDLARIDGSVPSRSRLFSDIATNAKLSALASVTEKRVEVSSRYPKNFGVYKKALELREVKRATSVPRTGTFLDGTHLLKQVRLR